MTTQQELTAIEDRVMRGAQILRNEAMFTSGGDNAMAVCQLLSAALALAWDSGMTNEDICGTFGAAMKDYYEHYDA